MPKVSHSNNVYFLRYTHPRYIKCLFTKQMETIEYVQKEPTFQEKYTTIENK